MNLLAWFRSKNWTAHTFAGLAVTVATIISTDPQARNFVLGFFVAHPVIGTDIIALAGLILKYSHSSSPAGTVATAQVILASPAAPTQAAVDAAKPSAPTSTVAKEVPATLPGEPKG